MCLEVRITRLWYKLYCTIEFLPLQAPEGESHCKVPPPRQRHRFFQSHTYFVCLIECCHFGNQRTTPRIYPAFVQNIRALLVWNALRRKIMASSNLLTRFLTTPSKVANTLEWKKLSSSVLALNIGRDEIGLTLASHPSCNERKSYMLNPIPLKFVNKENRKSLEANIISQLNNVVQSNNVCGFVVNWPLQKEGRLGASCGRVLHTLDLLCLDAETPILSNNRKFCLWNVLHVPLQQDDFFGRCSIYSKPYTNNRDFVHLASREQYNQCGVVGDIWSDFCRTHWPEINQEEQTLAKDGFSFDSEWLDDISENGCYIHAAALWLIRLPFPLFNPSPLETALTLYIHIELEIKR